MWCCKDDHCQIWYSLSFLVVMKTCNESSQYGLNGGWNFHQINEETFSGRKWTELVRVNKIKSSNFNS